MRARACVIERWMNSAGSDVDRYTYGYDRNGNVLSKTNVVKADHSLDETYAYDNLNRLAAANRNGSGYQTWTLDALGNMTAVATGGGTTDYRITNAQNQLVSMNGTSSGASANTFLAYDSNGNTIIDDQAHVLKYDAWNRLTVTADLAGNVKMTYAYDGLVTKSQLSAQVCGSPNACIISAKMT